MQRTGRPGTREKEIGFERERERERERYPSFQKRDAHALRFGSMNPISRFLGTMGVYKASHGYRRPRSTARLSKAEPADRGEVVADWRRGSCRSAWRRTRLSREQCGGDGQECEKIKLGSMVDHEDLNIG